MMRQTTNDYGGCPAALPQHMAVSLRLTVSDFPHLIASKLSFDAVFFKIDDGEAVASPQCAAPQAQKSSTLVSARPRRLTA